MNWNRRTFLASTGGALAAWMSPAGTMAAETGSTKRVGVIGCGWYGKCDLFRLIQVAPVQVVSICDPDRKMGENAAEMIATRQASGKQPRLFGDYREMLKEKDLDMVLVATPDHWHCLAAIGAMEAGADVYVQKPISRDVREGKAMLDTARRLGRVVQVGTQRRSTPHLIKAKQEIVEAGRLGTVGHVDICSYYHMLVRGRTPDAPVPEWLDWDMWCGPAPQLPYNPAYHPGSWRSFREFGNGIMGDMCIHMLDLARWVLDLGWPQRISSSAGIWVNRDSMANVPDTQTAIFEFDSMNVVWNYRTWGGPADPEYPWSCIIYGDKGTLKLSVNSYEFIPSKGNREKVDVVMELDQYPEDRTEERLEKHVAPAIRGHMRNWLECIANRGRPVADIEQGHISTASCILANISADTHRTLAWDPATHKVPNDEEATQLLAREYRAPWVHPGMG